MVEIEEGKYNFDKENKPINPISGKPITSWYKLGQTWTGQFADLATTVDECRAELVGAYLMDDLDLLELFGFTETSDIRAEDREQPSIRFSTPLPPRKKYKLTITMAVTYNLYQQLAVDGLRGLSNFNVDSGVCSSYFKNGREGWG